MRETLDAKARRYLCEGRLMVEHADGRVVRARCRGSGTYVLGYEAGAWWCSCPARRQCAHLAALQLVTTR